MAVSNMQPTYSSTGGTGPRQTAPWGPKKKEDRIHRHVIDMDGAQVKERFIGESKIVELACTCSVYQRVKPKAGPFCEHVEHVMVGGLDTVEAKTATQATRVALPAQVMVTVLRKPDLRAVVHLSNADERGVRKATLYRAACEGAEPIDPVVIGIVQRYDGRMVLRSMVWEWMIEQASMGLVPVCQSKHHFKGNRAVGVVDMEDRSAMADAGVRLMSGWCLACVEGDGIPDPTDI